jgi:hypothetical protein
VREVFLVGIATTDCLDTLSDPEFASYGAAAVFSHLERAWQRWHICDFWQLRSQSPLLHANLPEG